MLKQIINFSIENKLFIGVFTIVLIGMGLYQATKLPIDAVPDITDNQVQVITISPSLGAPDVERLITFPIEQVNSTIPGMKEIRSFSRFGLSVVTIVFEDIVDVYWARQQVTERLQQVQSQIPSEFGKPELAPVTTGLGEIYQYVIRPKPGYEKKYDAMELRTIQDWIVRRQLLGTEGVADVASFGGYLKQYEIAVNADKLNAYRISIDDIFNALQKNNQNTGGAYIEKGPTVLFIRSEGLVTGIDDIGAIEIKKGEGHLPVLIRDVANVGFGHATRYGAMTYNDEGEVAGAVVMMLKGGNSSSVIKSVKERIAEIQKTLPEGVIIEPFLDRTKMVNNAISTVVKNLIEGALIVIFVLVLFLGNLRAGLIVASVIPLSMLFAIILMNAFGVSGNLMSLGAIDFGLIVDGAVIIVEAVMHRTAHTHKRFNQQELNLHVKVNATRMMKAAVFGQMVILIVYIPLFFLQGIEGKMFMPMAQTVTFALLGAFLLSVTYVPMATSLFINKDYDSRPSFSDRIMKRIENFYDSTLLISFLNQKKILLSAIALFVVSVIVINNSGGEFMPSLEEGDFATETRVLTGSNLNVSIKTLSDAAHILMQKFPEVEKVVGKNGSSEIPTDPMPIDASDMMIILKDKKEWTSAATFDELAEKMNAELTKHIAGATFGFQYPVQMRFNELISGARQDVVCKIFGENLDSLALYAGKVGSIVNTLDGASDLYVETVTGMAQIVINYNRNVLPLYSLNISDVNRIVNAAFAGEVAGNVYEGEKRFDLVVRLEKSGRQDLSDVQHLLIPTSTGQQIPLSEIATVEIKEGPNQIQREDAKRRIIVGFNVRGRDVQSIVHELQSKVESQLKMSPGYFVKYGGAFENFESAKGRLIVVVPLSLLLIFLLLYSAFNSVKQGLIIFSAIPLSAIGGIFALAIRGMPFSISAGIGFIALFGVSVLNGVVLISEFNRLKDEGVTDIYERIRKSARIRLRPVLMTAAVASLGFLPMALSQGAGAEVQRPLATVVIGGLISATLLTLIILPLLYMMVEKRKLHPMKTFLLIAGLSFLTLNVRAQQPISLQAALDSTLKNNYLIEYSKLSLKQREQNKKSAYDIPKTNLSGEYGQFNSINSDYKFGISQSFDFPGVYINRNSYYKTEIEKQKVDNAQIELEVKGEVRRLYYQILILREKEKLLFRLDSAFKGFYERATNRLKAGETNFLENISAESQRQQIAIELKNIQNDITYLIQRFNQMIRTTQPYEPSGDFTAAPFALNNIVTLDKSLIIKSAEADTRAKQYLWKVEKSKMWPDITLGYFTQSIMGYEMNDGLNQYYGNNLRFNYWQAGLSIPIFFPSFKSRINTAKISRDKSQIEYQMTKQHIGSNFSKAMNDYDASMQNLNTYTDGLLKKSDTILETADMQLLNGNLNYLEWTQLIRQAIEIKKGYFEVLEILNESVITIKNLSGE